MRIKAIETEYAGCRFRSRLEARWAVFFDALGIYWAYEPEGFETPHGWYLPDFRIKAWGETVWVEVKPGDYRSVDIADEDYEKCADFAESVRLSHYWVLGDVPLDFLEGWPIDNCGGCTGAPSLHIKRFLPSDSEFLEDQISMVKEWFGCSGDPATCDLCRRNIPRWRNMLMTECVSLGHFSNKEFQTALIKARSARFEHGERP